MKANATVYRLPDGKINVSPLFFGGAPGVGAKEGRSAPDPTPASRAAGKGR